MDVKLDFKKYDKYGQVLRPGNVCVRLVKDNLKSSIGFCIYKEEVRGSKSKGTYGRFITPEGVRSIKYSNVIFVFDTISETRSKSNTVRELTKQYYEGKRKAN
jgi:hypothetical protein